MKYHIEFSNGTIAGPYTIEEAVMARVKTPIQVVKRCSSGPDGLCLCEVANLQKLKSNI